MKNKEFIDENFEWLAKNPLKISRFSPKGHLWYIQLPNDSMMTFTHEEYEYLISKVNESIIKARKQ